MSEHKSRQTALVEKLIDSWLIDHRVIYSNESERRKALFSSIKQHSKAWTKPRICMYRGCTKPSIPKSHTLQRKHVLEAIAEDGHVVSPTLDNDGLMIVDRIGIGNASTFPGFCSEHETLFADFEFTGQIEQARHVALQAYRTLCHEIARREFIDLSLKEDLKSYVAQREKYFHDSLKKDLPSAKLSRIEIKGDESEQMVNDGLSQNKRTLLHLQVLYEALTDLIEEKSSNVIAQGVFAPVKIPLSLSGIVLMNYRKQSQRIRVAPCVLGVIPQTYGTLLFAVTLSNHGKILDWWNKQIQFGFHALEMIEGWMTHGTDHWFMKPSVWSSINPERQQLILDDLRSAEGIPSITPAQPIFDDIREYFIKEAELEVARATDASHDFLDIIEKQKAKLNR